MTRGLDLIADLHLPLDVMMALQAVLNERPDMVVRHWSTGIIDLVFQTDPSNLSQDIVDAVLAAGFKKDVARLLREAQAMSDFDATYDAAPAVTIEEKWNAIISANPPMRVVIALQTLLDECPDAYIERWYGYRLMIKQQTMPISKATEEMLDVLFKRTYTYEPRRNHGQVAHYNYNAWLWEPHPR